jgi:hypothetical protein
MSWEYSKSSEILLLGTCGVEEMRVAAPGAASRQNIRRVVMKKYGMVLAGFSSPLFASARSRRTAFGSRAEGSVG